MATPITATHLLRLNYTVQGHQHRADFWVNNPTGTLADPSTTSTPANAPLGSVPFTTVMLDVEDTIGGFINGSLDLWTFISYSQTAPNYNPLWFAQPTRTPSSGNTSYVGAQFGMVLKAGRTKGRVVFNELGIAQPPYRGAPANPDSTNPQIWDKVAKWYLRDGYFTLRDGSRATVSFKPSGEYNKKLLKMRNLR